MTFIRSPATSTFMPSRTPGPDTSTWPLANMPSVTATRWVWPFGSITSTA